MPFYMVEYSGNLDTDSARFVVQEFKRIAQKHNKCVIIVTHNQETAKYANKIFYIDNHRMVSM